MAKILINKYIDFAITIKNKNFDFIFSPIGYDGIYRKSSKFYHVQQISIFKDENNVNENFLQYKNFLLNKFSYKKNEIFDYWMNNKPAEPIEIKLEPVIISNEIKEQSGYYAHEYGEHIPFKYTVMRTKSRNYFLVNAKSRSHYVLDGFDNSYNDDFIVQHKNDMKWENGCGDYAYYSPYENKMTNNYNGIDLSDERFTNTIFKIDIVNNELVINYDAEILGDLFRITKAEMKQLTDELKEDFYIRNFNDQFNRLNQAFDLILKDVQYCVLNNKEINEYLFNKLDSIESNLYEPYQYLILSEFNLGGACDYDDLSKDEYQSFVNEWSSYKKMHTDESEALRIKIKETLKLIEDQKSNNNQSISAKDLDQAVNNNNAEMEANSQTKGGQR